MAAGLTGRVREFSQSTRTASDAASAIGCEVRQIVKSLLFRTRDSGLPVLVLASGDHRVDQAWMERFAGEPLVRADPEYVRSITGFAIGGVPPLGLSTPLTPFIDYDLLELKEVWAAAGHPHAVCRLDPSELLAITGGRPVSVVPIHRQDGSPWVSFDCFGTLVDWRTGFHDTLRRVTSPLSDEQFHRLFEEYLRRERMAEALPYRPYRSVLSDALVEAGRVVGVPISLGDGQAIADSIPGWPLFPDTLSALERLRQTGRKVAILSNMDRDLLDETLAHHHMGTDLTITSEEVRAYKPALAHWVRLLKLTAISPQETWHVSAGYEYDIPPALRLGFRTAFVGRYVAQPPGPGAETVVRHLGEFVGRIAPSPGT
jgi:2-haloalkanoic acid dehalogenase type II